jgi:archaellin
MAGDISGPSGLPVIITFVIVAAVFVSILIWSTRSRRHDGS